MPWCICYITNFNWNDCIHFTFHSHLLHSAKWSEKQSCERNVLKKADLILMQMPKQRSAFWCSEPQHRCLKTSSPDKWMLSTFFSLILVCLSLQWEKYHVFALKCGYKRRSLINVCCREYSEAAAYNNSPPPHMLRKDWEYCLVIKAWAWKKGKGVPSH